MRFSLYGLPQFAISATEVFLRLHLLIYFTGYLRLSGVEAGFIVSGSLIISALFDPLLGSKIDKLKSTKGQVTQFIIFALFVMMFFILMIFVPSWGADQTFILFLLTLGYQISYSAFLIPYLSLAKGLIQEEKDIVSLYAWRYFFGSIGALVGVSLPFLKLVFNVDSYAPMAYAMVGLILVLAPGSLKMVREKKVVTPIRKSEQNLPQSLLALLQNRVFLGYYLTFTILSIGLGLNQTLAIYYYKFGLGLTDSETNILLGIYMLVFCASIPFWAKYSEKKGKKKALTIGFIVITAVTLCYPFMPERNFVLLYTLIIFAGLFTGIVALIDSYLSNIIDFYTYKVREKKANLIFGVWRISDKLSRACGIYLAGIVLDMTINSSSAVINIKQAFGFGVFIFLFPASIIFALQKYNDTHHEKVMRILKRKSPDLLYKAEELEP